MNRLACLAAALALLSFGAHAAPAPNELPSIPAPNGVVRATPSAIIIPENPAVPDGAGCVVGSTGCALAVTATASGTGDVNIKQVGGNTVTTTVPVSGTVALSGTSGVNLAQVNGQTVNVGTGAAGTGTQRVTTSSDSAIATVGTITNAVTIAGGNFQIAPTVTVQNAAYSAGNSLGGLITVTGAARTAGGTGLVDALRLRSAGGSTNAVWIYAWSKTPAATCTDKVAFVGNSADLPFSIPGFPVSGTLGNAPGAWDTSTVVQIGGLTSNFKNQDTSPGTSIYVCMVTGAAVTPAATTDITLIVGGFQD